MDRPARLLGWLLPPVLAMALGVAAWLAVRDAEPSHPSAGPPPTDRPGVTPWRASAGAPSEPQPPRRLPRGEPPQWLPPLHAGARSVMAAEFIAEENEGNEDVVGLPWPDEQRVPANPPDAEGQSPPRTTAPAREEALPGSSPGRGSQPPKAGRARSARTPVAAVLSPPTAAKERSLQLERIAGQADRQTRRGFALAERGAYFAARAEFIKALRLIAEGLDAELQTHTHSRALGAGLTAVREADDFLDARGAAGASPDLVRIAAGHGTPIFNDADLAGLTPLAATQSYLGFAQEQLAAAAGEELAGSMALYALGKLNATLAARGSREIPAAGPKAVTFFQAALLVFPRNHLASNDLGVLLAQGGHHRDAYRALVHSLSICPHSTGWHNLAVVLSHLGDAKRAQQAEHLAAVARKREALRRQEQTGSAHGLVRWIDPGAFAKTSTTPGGPGRAVPSPALRHAPSAPAPRPSPTATTRQPVDPPAPRVVRQPGGEPESSTTGWRWPWQPEKRTK